MENYFESQKQTIFRNVEVLIYVFDVESRELGELNIRTLEEFKYLILEFINT